MLNPRVVFDLGFGVRWFGKTIKIRERCDYGMGARTFAFDHCRNGFFSLSIFVFRLAVFTQKSSVWSVDVMFFFFFVKKRTEIELDYLLVGDICTLPEHFIF